MSDPKVNGSNSDQVSNVNVDELLSDIKQMADHVEDLIGKEEETKSPLTPQTSAVPATLPTAEEAGTAAPAGNPEIDQAQELAQMDQLACQAAEEIGKEIQAQKAEEENSDPSASEAESSEIAIDPDPQKEIQVDEHIDKLAEEEINEAIGKLDHKENNNIVEAAVSPEEQSLQIDDVPGLFRVFLKALLILDRPFLWLPRPIKDLLGYIGLATFFLAVVLWVIVIIMDKR